MPLPNPALPNQGVLTLDRPGLDPALHGTNQIDQAFEGMVAQQPYDDEFAKIVANYDTPATEASVTPATPSPASASAAPMSYTARHRATTPGGHGGGRPASPPPHMAYAVGGPNAPIAVYMVPPPGGAVGGGGGQPNPFAGSSYRPLGQTKTAIHLLQPGRGEMRRTSPLDPIYQNTANLPNRDIINPYYRARLAQQVRPRTTVRPPIPLLGRLVPRITNQFRSETHPRFWLLGVRGRYVGERGIVPQVRQGLAGWQGLRRARIRAFGHPGQPRSPTTHGKAGRPLIPGRTGPGGPNWPAIPNIAPAPVAARANLLPRFATFPFQAAGNIWRGPNILPVRALGAAAMGLAGVLLAPVTLPPGAVVAGIRRVGRPAPGP